MFEELCAGDGSIRVETTHPELAEAKTLHFIYQQELFYINLHYVVRSTLK